MPDQYIGDVADAAEEAIREDGQAPAKLPEWVVHQEPPPEPSRSILASCNVTEHSRIVVEHSPSGGGGLHIYCLPNNPTWPRNGDQTEQRLATLQFAAAEMERALPVIRAMIREMKGK